MRVAAEAQAPLPSLWKKRATSDRLSPYLQGLVCVDRVGRLGVCTLGEGRLLRDPAFGGRCYGGCRGPQADREGGYPNVWGLPGYGWKGVQAAKLPSFFLGGGREGWVGISKCFQPPHCSFVRPRQDVSAEGVPDD